MSWHPQAPKPPLRTGMALRWRQALAIGLLLALYLPFAPILLLSVLAAAFELAGQCIRYGIDWFCDLPLLVAIEDRYDRLMARVGKWVRRS